MTGHSLVTLRPSARLHFLLRTDREGHPLGDQGDLVLVLELARGVELTLDLSVLSRSALHHRTQQLDDVTTLRVRAARALVLQGFLDHLCKINMEFIFTS